MNYRHTTHIFHAVMCFFTAGAWAIVWLLCALLNAQHNRSVEINLMKEKVEEMKRINGSNY